MHRVMSCHVPNNAAHYAFTAINTGRCPYHISLYTIAEACILHETTQYVIKVKYMMFTVILLVI